jgi:CRP-like cAMP-binding protein
VFHDLILRYLYALIKQIAQTSVCNHFHTIEERLCRWLAVMCERSQSDRLALTQEFLAHMLGVQRTSIGLIATSLQNVGIIKYSRGIVEVRDADRLRKSACECYNIVNGEYDGIYRKGKL